MLSCELIHCHFVTLLTRFQLRLSSVIQERCQHLEALLLKVLDKLPTSTEQPIPPDSNHKCLPTPKDDAENRPSPGEGRGALSGSQCESWKDDAVQPVLKELLDERKKVTMDILADIQRQQTKLLLSRMARTPAVSFDEHPGLKVSFEESVGDYEAFFTNTNRVSPYSPRFWLRKATWWLLKSRKIRDVFEENSWRSQAHIDVWKACWLVYEKVLGENNIDIPELEDRHLLKDLLKVYYIVPG